MHGLNFQIQNSNLFKGREINIEPNKSIIITYGKYSTSSLICLRRGIYLFSNGYITTISKDDDISVSISDDYLTLTFKSFSAEYLHGMLILTDQIPAITSA